VAGRARGGEPCAARAVRSTPLAGSAASSSSRSAHTALCVVAALSRQDRLTAMINRLPRRRTAYAR
jgi:hypothetical protein